MGRLPSSFARREITFREPYALPGELIVAGSASGVQFPDATFLNNTSCPYELHRMIPRITGLDDNNDVVATQPSQELLSSLVRLRIINLQTNNPLMRASTLINTLVKGSSERTWEWADPLYLTNSGALQVMVDTLAIPVFNPVVVSLRVELTFEGFIVVLAPPTENR